MHATAPKLAEPKPTEQDIHGRIYDAILARRLPPGARLGEEELAGLFGVSRTKVRAAIARLAQDGVVQSRRNRGASVAAPTRAEAGGVLEFRRILEPPMVSALAERRPPGLAALHAHLAAEHAARAAGDDPALIRLTGDFHLRLAALHGNAPLCRALREAEALTCLSILRFGRPDRSCCLPDEHDGILAAIEAGEAGRAARLMLHHLDHIAAGMDLAGPGAPAEALDLAAALNVERTAAR